MPISFCKTPVKVANALNKRGFAVVKSKHYHDDFQSLVYKLVKYPVFVTGIETHQDYIVFINCDTDRSFVNYMRYGYLGVGTQNARIVCSEGAFQVQISLLEARDDDEEDAPDEPSGNIVNPSAVPSKAYAPPVGFNNPLYYSFFSKAVGISKEYVGFNDDYEAYFTPIAKEKLEIAKFRKQMMNKLNHALVDVEDMDAGQLAEYNILECQMGDAKQDARNAINSLREYIKTL